MALKIALKWGKDPDWFFSLEDSIQSSIIAEYYISNLSSEEFEKRKKIAKKSALEWKQNRKDAGVIWAK